MFRQAFRLGKTAFKSLGKQKTVQIGVSLLGMSLFQRYKVQNQNKSNQINNDSNSSQKDPKQQQTNSVVEEDAIYLNKQTYMSKLLGNKHENYILIVYAEENQEDTTNSIKAAKHIKKIIKSQRVSESNLPNVNTDINVYVVSRPTLEDVKKMANRIMDFKIYEREENPQPIEIYIKTVHSNDSVYVKWKRESFYTDYKSTKFIKKLQRYLGLFEHFENTTNVEQTRLQEQHLAEIFQRQYVKLNEPVIIKCTSASSTLKQKNQSVLAKQQHKDLKLFKRLCFICAERKLIPLKSRFVLLENKEIMRQLNLEDGQIYILRNDMVQKLENSKEISETNDHKKKIVVNDEFMYIPNQRNASGKNEKLAYFTNHLESYLSFKGTNTQLLKTIDTLSRENGKAQNSQDLEEMKEEAVFVNFIMPRITFLRDAKFGSIGKLFKKITFSKEKHVLALNLQSDDKTTNHSRILTFRKLYEQYKNEFTFLLVDTDELVDLFPHMESNQPQFSVFNFFNVDKSLSKVGKYYKHLIFPFEKYFLRDQENFYEEFSTLQQQVEKVLLQQGKKEYVMNQQDMIPLINSDILDKLLSNSVHPFIVQITDDSPNSRLSQFTLNQIELERISHNFNQNPQSNDNSSSISKESQKEFAVLENEGQKALTDVKFYRMNSLNQHPFLRGREGDQKGTMYLFVDPGSKQVILAPSQEQFSISSSRHEFLSFVQRCKAASELKLLERQNKDKVNYQQLSGVPLKQDKIQSATLEGEKQKQGQAEENQGSNQNLGSSSEVTEIQINSIAQSHKEVHSNKEHFSEKQNQKEEPEQISHSLISLKSNNRNDENSESQISEILATLTPSASVEETGSSQQTLITNTTEGKPNADLSDLSTSIQQSEGKTSQEEQSEKGSKLQTESIDKNEGNKIEDNSESVNTNLEEIKSNHEQQNSDNQNQSP